MGIKDLKSRENKALTKEDYQSIDRIRIDELREFTLRSLERYGSVDKLREANQVANNVVAVLTYKGLINEHTNQSFVDIMISATLLHNVFYDEDDWITLFYARKYLDPIAKEMGIDEQATSALFHTIEAQLGDRTPVAECIPKLGTPTDLVATAVWYTRNGSV